MQVLEQAEFVISLSQFQSASLKQAAHVILPIAAFTETSGTYVNAAGDWQSFKGISAAFAEARPAWKVLRVMGNVMCGDGFDYESSEAVREELRINCHPERSEGSYQYGKQILRYAQDDKQNSIATNILSRIGEIPMYQMDSLVRRAKALQAAQMISEGKLAAVRIHPQTAAKLQIKDGRTVTVKQQNHRAQLPVILDVRVPEQAALIAGALAETCGLDGLFGEVEIIL
jgi:NADH-quinone oxidoreductase subunit G